MVIFWMFLLVLLLAVSARIWHNLSRDPMVQPPLEAAAYHYVSENMSCDEYALLMDAFRSRQL